MDAILNLVTALVKADLLTISLQPTSPAGLSYTAQKRAEGEMGTDLLLESDLLKIS